MVKGFLFDCEFLSVRVTLSTRDGCKYQKRLASCRHGLLTSLGVRKGSRAKKASAQKLQIVPNMIVFNHLARHVSLKPMAMFLCRIVGDYSTISVMTGMGRAEVIKL